MSGRNARKICVLLGIGFCLGSGSVHGGTNPVGPTQDPSSSRDDFRAVGGISTFSEFLRTRAFVRSKVDSPGQDGTQIALTLSVEDPTGPRYQRVHFFPLTPEAGGIRWVAVGRMTVDTTDEYQVRTSFAESGSCPAMIDQLAMAEQLKMPVIDLLDIPIGTGPIRPRDGLYAPLPGPQGLDYELSAPSFFFDTDTLAHTSIGGSDNTPLGAWARSTMVVLEPCWMNALPAELTGDVATTSGGH